MATYLDETFGLVIYQEQVMRLCREVGKLTWEDTTQLRKAMSKSYGKEFFDRYGERFVDGAMQDGISKDDAWAMWDQINSMGSWSFNKSHSVSYAIISYWTAWLKAHHNLQYIAAALRNAKDDDSVVSLLREYVEEGGQYIPFDIELSDMNWSVQKGILVGGFMNLVGFGPAKSMQAIQKRATGKLAEKDIERINNAKNKFAKLYPMREHYQEWYDNPQDKGVADGWSITELADLPEEGECIVLGKITEKDLRDENEVVRLARRGGVLRQGQSKFVDFRIVDDSTTKSIIVRISTRLYNQYGESLVEKAIENNDVFLIRGKRIRNYPMIKAEKIRCLTNESMFS